MAKLDSSNPVVGHDTFGVQDIGHLYDRYGTEISELLRNVYMFMFQGDQLNGARFGESPLRPERKRRRKWLAGQGAGEVGEFLDADFANDFIEYIDAAIDVSYVAYGALIEAVEGNLTVADILIKEVCRSNDTKLVGMTVDDDGKIQKGPHYEPPRISAVLHYYGYNIPPLIGVAKTDQGDRISLIDKQVDETAGEAARRLSGAPEYQNGESK